MKAANLAPAAGADVLVRAARPADAAPLAALARATWLETFGDDYEPRDLHAYFDEHYTAGAMAIALSDPAVDVQIAERDEAAIGYVWICPLSLPAADAPAGAVELKRLYVRAAAQGGGLGRRLLDWAIAAARRGGAPALYLNVWAENRRARAIYGKRGFVTVGRFDFRVGARIDDELIMRLDLAP